MTDCRPSEHGNGHWQQNGKAFSRTYVDAGLAENLAEKDGRRVPKRAGDCRSRETRETLKMPEKTGFLELRRLSQLGYGDLICKYLQNKALRQGKSRLAEKVGRKLRPFPPTILATSARFTGILAGFWGDA